MPDERFADVVVMHPHCPMRRMLQMALAQHGYAVSEAPTYTAVLRSLRAAAGPTLVVAGNWAATTQAEEEFFGRIAADAELARRHRFVLLSTVPEWHAPAFEALLRALGVVVLRVPFHLPELLETVAALAGKRASTDEDSDADVSVG